MILLLSIAALLCGVSDAAPTNGTAATTTTGKRILIMGDSWGTISPATQFFEAKLKEHNCPLGGFTNIAVGGTTAKQWSTDGFFGMLSKVKAQAKQHDIIWITLMGNDALAEMPGCASSGKSADACGDQLFADCTGYMTTILDAIHAANPAAVVVGFGYDTMFGGLGCSFFTHDLFPQCWSNKSAAVSPNRCFNDQATRIQELWESLAAKYAFVTAINLLGTTQVAGGTPNATVGHPNMEEMGPSKYWPITLECIHPSTSGSGDTSGAMIIMEEFYKQYWSKSLGC